MLEGLTLPPPPLPLPFPSTPTQPTTPNINSAPLALTTLQCSAGVGWAVGELHVEQKVLQGEAQGVRGPGSKVTKCHVPVTRGCGHLNGVELEREHPKQQRREVREEEGIWREGHYTQTTNKNKTNKQTNKHTAGVWTRLIFC